MPARKAKRPKGRKPVKYKTITIKVTARQKRSLVRYSLSRNTTPNKLIKRAIRPLLENYADLEIGERIKKEKVQQLELF